MKHRQPNLSFDSLSRHPAEQRTARSAVTVTDLDLHEIAAANEAQSLQVLAAMEIGIVRVTSDSPKHSIRGSA